MLGDDRRRFPRLNAPVYWRSPGLRGPRRPAVDVSMGGLRMYSDDAVKVGERLELELFLNDESIKFLARVVWLDELPDASPAKFDVGLEFLDVPVAVRGKLAAALAAKEGR